MHERVRTAVHGSVTAEFATAGGGRPMVYPLTPFYDERRECVVVTSPPAYAGKVDAVRENPAVALHCYGGGERGQGCLVRGTATVDDEDVHANGEYVASLIADEPDGEKREAFSDSSVLESRLGRLLMDWYTLRVVVRIDPTEVVAVPDVPARPSPSAPDVKRLGQRVVRGRVVGVEDGRVSVRAGSQFSMRRETRLDMLRSVLEGKRRTRAYFGESGLTGWFW